MGARPSLVANELSESMSNEADVVIVGGGVIGWSIAYELACRCRSVILIDARQPVGRQASRAGAGILPAPMTGPGCDVTESLRQLAHPLHADWSTRLFRETGIDNEYQRCGGIHLARTVGEGAALRADMGDRSVAGGQISTLDRERLASLEPELNVAGIEVAYCLPGEAQIRSPRHMQALEVACQQRGVTQIAGRVERWYDDGASLRVSCNGIEVRGESIVLAAGAWAGELLQRHGVRTGIEPIRGQIVVWRAPRPLLRRVINEGHRYVLCRRDGYVLAGATVDECGFVCDSRPADVAELRAFAESLVPALRDVPIESTWAGLRPGSRRGHPYLGSVPGHRGVFVAAGHHRSGLHLAPATAIVIADLLHGQTPAIDLRPFGLSA